MKRRLDEYRTHCGPHLCDHEADDLPLTWRYSVVSRGYALSLNVSKSGGDFVLHLEPATSKLSARAYKHCDLLEGPCEVPHPKSLPPPLLPSPTGLTSLIGIPGQPAPPPVAAALMFWSEYAVSGQTQQPERFWRALERRAKSMVAEARAGRYMTTCCPRCRGVGTIELKPRSKQ